MTRFVQPQLAASPLPAPYAPPKTTLPSETSVRDGSRTLAAMLMAAALSALLVVADQLIDTWADGHLMLAWVLLWSVAFATLALLAVPMRHLASRAAHVLHGWWDNYQRERDEETMWEYAKRDPRIMADLQAARARQQAE